MVIFNTLGEGWNGLERTFHTKAIDELDAVTKLLAFMASKPGNEGFRFVLEGA